RSAVLQSPRATITRMTDRKKTSLTSRLAVGLFLLLVVYPLSFGPAFWCHAHLFIAFGQDIVNSRFYYCWSTATTVFYWPLNLALSLPPDRAQHAMKGSRRLWVSWD